MRGASYPALIIIFSLIASISSLDPTEALSAELAYRGEIDADMRDLIASPPGESKPGSGVAEPSSAVLSRPGDSVRIRESFEFSSKQSLDDFLGDYDRGFSSSEESYDGSRSESPAGLRGLPF